MDREVATDQAGVRVLRSLSEIDKSRLAEIRKGIRKVGGNGQRNQYSLIHYFAERGNELAVQILIDNGTNIEVRSRRKTTPLHFASRAGQEDVVEWLIETGADVEARTSACATPLNLAARNGHLTVVRLLLSKGANIEAKTNSQKTS